MEQNIQKRMDESVSTLLSKVEDAKPNSYKTKRDKNGNLIITYKKHVYEDYTISDKVGYIFLFCVLFIPITIFLTTHLFYLSPLIVLLVIGCFYYLFCQHENKPQRRFLKRILTPLMIVSCLLSTSYSWNRMNSKYESNANMKKSQIEKVNKNIPKWLYSIDFKKEKKNLETSLSNNTFEDTFKRFMNK